MLATKVLIVACAVAVASAVPVDQYSHKHHKAPKPYSFSYGVEDKHYGPNFGQKEVSDGKTTKGSYSVQLSDGRKQVVTYTADHHNGYHADVQYYGKAQYPPPSKYPPFVVKKQHHYAPEPHFDDHHQPSYH